MVWLFPINRSINAKQALPEGFCLGEIYSLLPTWM